MAVATDSHRDFLIPEHTVSTVRPTTNTTLVFRCSAFIPLCLYYNTKAHALQEMCGYFTSFSSPTDRIGRINAANDQYEGNEILHLPVPEPVFAIFSFHTIISTDSIVQAYPPVNIKHVTIYQI